MLLLKTNKPEIKIVVISDDHLGHKEHAGRHHARTIDYIKKNKCYWIHLGDGMENVTPDRDGGMQEDQILNPTKQYMALAGHFEKIKDQCLAIVPGNHEFRSKKMAFINISEILAHHLNLLDRYFPVGGIHSIQVQDQVYKVVLYHGATNSAVNKYAEHAKRFAIHPSADIIYMGHTHHLGHQAIIVLDEGEDGKETGRLVHFVRTGTYLKYADYARLSGYPPGRIGSTVSTFYGKEKKIVIDDQTLAAI